MPEPIFTKDRDEELRKRIEAAQARLKARTQQLKQGVQQAQKPLLGPEQIKGLKPVQPTAQPIGQPLTPEQQRTAARFAQLPQGEIRQATGKEKPYGKKPWWDLILPVKLAKGLAEPAQKASEILPSIVTSPWTPEVPKEYKSPEQQDWLGQRMAQYQQWEAPIGLKPALEIGLDPFMAAGGVSLAKLGLKGIAKLPQLPGKGLGQMAKGIAEKEARAVAEFDPIVAKVTNTIKEVKPARKAYELEKHLEMQKRMGKVAGQMARGEGRVTLQKSLAQLKGELPVAQEITPLIEAGVTNTEATHLFNKIWANPQMFSGNKLTAGKALEKLVFKGKLPTRDEIGHLEEVFGSKFVGELLKKRKLGDKVWDATIEAINLPRAFLASLDLSASLRQGIFFNFAYPTKSLGWIKNNARSFASEKYSKQLDTAIRSNAHFPLAERAKLFIGPLAEKAPAAAREEVYISRWARKFPWVRWSERSYVNTLNKMRTDTFYKEVDSMIKRGLDVEGKDFVHVKALANFLNIASGRGVIPAKLKGIAPMLSGIFFSPRLQLARMQMPFTLLSSSPQVRKMAARMMVGTFGSIATVLGILKASGVSDVNIDPRSSDFGKVRIGNTRIDPWGGFQQYAVALTRMVTRQRATRKGDIVETDPKDVAGRAAWSKLSPWFGFLVDLMKGHTFLGDELSAEPENVKEQAYNRLMPMFAQDVVDSIREEGFVGGLIATPGVLGVGIQAYSDLSELDQLIKEETDRQDIPWEQVTSYQRQALINEFPHLQTALEEQRERIERTGDPLYTEYYGAIDRARTQYQTTVDAAAQGVTDGQWGHKDFRVAAGEAGRSLADAYEGLEGDTKFDKMRQQLEQRNERQKLEANDWDLALYEYMAVITEGYEDIYGEFDYSAYEESIAEFQEKWGGQRYWEIRELIRMKRLLSPQSMQLLEQLEIDREHIGAYYKIRDDYEERFPAAKKAFEAEEAALRITDPVAGGRAVRLARANATLKLANSVIKNQRQAYRRLHPEVDAALQRWGYTDYLIGMTQ